MMPPTDSLLATIEQRLTESGLTLDVERSGTAADEGYDAIITLARGVNRRRYIVQIQRRPTLGSLALRRPVTSSDHLLVVCDHISRRSATALRGAGIQFVDTLGNSYIAFGDVLIDVQGRTDALDRARHAHDEAGAPQTPINLFSARRSQVILALLTWPELAAGKVRAVSEAAGVSVGQAHSALSELGRAGYLVPGSATVDRFDDLLDYWATAYPGGLGRTLELARYHGNIERPVQTPGDDQPFYLSGESADGADVARPATLTIYVDSPHSRMAVLNRWDASPDKTSNVFVRRAFWRAPHPEEDSPPVTRRNAPWPLVYADLLATGDARLREVAATWKRRHV